MPNNVLLKFNEADPGIEVESFTDAESQSLEEVATNTCSNIFAWKLAENLTPEQIGALLSRYSRTTLTGRRLFLKEFLPNRERGSEFFKAWLVDYGDDSIQEMAGGLPMSCEFVSNLAVKEIEDSRMGSYIEKSSRYVAFDRRMPSGEYMFYNDPDIAASRHGDEYLSLMHGLFDSYVHNMPAMASYIRDANPFEKQSFRMGDSSITVSDLTGEMEERYGTSAEELRKAYENAVKASALDFIRDYLPLSTLTHVGMSMNARSYDGMLNKMMASPLAESRWIAERMLSELKKIVPSLVKRVGEGHGAAQRKFLSRKGLHLSEHLRPFSDMPIDTVTRAVDLADFTARHSTDPDAKVQTILVGIILYRYGAGQSLAQSMQRAQAMTEKERLDVISRYVGSRQNRRQKPGRAFENIEYLFDLRGRVGIYRDIQRHRIGTQERQNFNVSLGYDTRKEFNEIGIADDYKSRMSQVRELYAKLRDKLPYQAQYVVTYGFYTRWYYRMNARQLFHFCELRSTPSGHPDYRKMAQDMYGAVKSVHPTIAQYMKFVNLDEKQIGRLESEIRIAIKKKSLSK